MVIRRRRQSEVACVKRISLTSDYETCYWLRFFNKALLGKISNRCSLLILVSSLVAILVLSRSQLISRRWDSDFWVRRLFQTCVLVHLLHGFSLRVLKFSYRSHIFCHLLNIRCFGILFWPTKTVLYVGTEEYYVKIGHVSVVRFSSTLSN
jgi:hypothetical protein